MDTSYQVIARRWRPKNFTELVGQEPIIKTLSNAIEYKRIAHAYLFVGPRGTGKTSTARLLAQALNCENGPKIDPNPESEICLSIMQGRCMDVIEIDGASNNSVDQIRSLREDCQYAPVQCTFKIYIIDEVHMLSTAAFNALLKTLEEPPAHVKFIFATTEANKVLPTIVSRCQRFEFRPIETPIIIEKLKTIAEHEKITIAPNALLAIARLANGGMRDAQSILDQMIAFCGQTIEEKDVISVYGLASTEEIHSFKKALYTGNYLSITELVHTFSRNNKDLWRAVIDIQASIREDLLSMIAKGYLEYEDKKLTTENILRMLDSLHESEKSIQTGLSEVINFEISLLKAIDQSKTRSIDTLIKQLIDHDNTPELKKKLKTPSS